MLVTTRLHNSDSIAEEGREVSCIRLMPWPPRWTYLPRDAYSRHVAWLEKLVGCSEGWISAWTRFNEDDKNLEEAVIEGQMQAW